MVDEDVHTLRFRIKNKLGVEKETVHAVERETDKEVLKCIYDELSESEKPVQVVPKAPDNRRAHGTATPNRIGVTPINSKVAFVNDNWPVRFSIPQSTKDTKVQRYQKKEEPEPNQHEVPTVTDTLFTVGPKEKISTQEPVQDEKNKPLEKQESQQVLVIEDVNGVDNSRLLRQPQRIKRGDNGAKGGQPTRLLRNYEGLYTKSLPMLTHFFVSSKGKNMADILDS